MSSRSDAPLVYERLSDPILVTRAKDGDASALAALCERHAPRVEKLALHLLRDPEDARDAAQDSLAKLVVRVRQFRGESQFSTWLHRLVVNTCKDFAQAPRRAPHRAAARGRAAARDGDPVAAVTAAETRRELGRCLAELPPAQATVVALKDAFDLGFAEISAATGLPVGTAKCYAHRGRERAARAALRMTRSRSARRRSRRSSRTAIRSCSSTRCSSSFPASGSSRARRSPRRTAPATFPGNPIMPGVKMVEALAQCGAVAVLSQPENRGKLVLFAGIDDVRFKRIVRPGEVLDLVCEVETVRGPVGKGKVRASVGGELAVRGTLTFAVAANDRPRERPADLDHRPRLPRARARADERRAVATLVDTTDEWIRDRTGIRERRIAADDRGDVRSLAPGLPRRALEMAGVEPSVASTW